MRVLVCRAEPQGSRTARALDADGHTALVGPVTEIVETEAPRPAGRFDALLVTSAHGVDGPTMDAPRALPVFAVGRATAEAARGAGFMDVRTSEGDAAALADLLRLTRPAPARLLYAAGRDRKPVLERTLGDAGYAIVPWVRYEARPLDRWPEAIVEALANGRIDAVLQFSRRGASLTLDLARRHDILDRLCALRHVCLSEDVAAPLREAGAPRIDVAARADEPSLRARLAAS